MARWQGAVTLAAPMAARLPMVWAAPCTTITPTRTTKLNSIKILGHAVQRPDEVLLTEPAGAAARLVVITRLGGNEGSAGDHAVSHLLQAVEQVQAGGGELKPPHFLVPGVGVHRAFLPCNRSAVFNNSANTQKLFFLLTKIQPTSLYFHK